MNTTNAAPFRSAHSALNWAHGIAGRGVYDRPVTSREEKREPGIRVDPKFEGLTPMENHAQAAWIAKMTEQCEALTPLEREVMTAVYTAPNDTALEKRKVQAVERVAIQVFGQQPSANGLGFVEDITRRFCRLTYQTDQAWGTTLHKSNDAVRAARRRITKRLHDLLDSALDKLDVAFEERGYVAA